jgi:thiol:disulfide interchange protein DsbD
LRNLIAMRPLLSLLLALSLAPARGQGHPVRWSFMAEQDTSGAPVVALHANCDEGWHYYALTLPREDGPFPTVIHLAPSAAYQAAGPVVEPLPVEVEDPNFMMMVRYHGDGTVFRLPLKRLSNEAFNVEGGVEFMCCNDQMCLPPTTVKFNVPFPAVK